MTARQLGGSISEGRHVLPIRVYYEDTDFSGAVYHASYLRFFERGRTELLRAVGFHQSALHGRTEGPLAFVVRRMAIEFRRPARMDDLLQVQTQPLLVRGALLELVQTILRHGETLAECKVSVAAVSKGRARRLPPELCVALAGMTTSASSDDL